MRKAIVCYDLKNVKSGDNSRVKEKLESIPNTVTTFQALNFNSLFPEWVNFRLPDTTFYVSVNSSLVTTEQIAKEVWNVIESIDAVPDKVYVAFITNDFILNAK